MLCQVCCNQSGFWAEKGKWRSLHWKYYIRCIVCHFGAWNTTDTGQVFSLSEKQDRVDVHAEKGNIGIPTKSVVYWQTSPKLGKSWPHVNDMHASNDKRENSYGCACSTFSAIPIFRLWILWKDSIFFNNSMATIIIRRQQFVLNDSWLFSLFAHP